ncbi:MAG: hypothetical protein P1V97_29775, partial [Planctomycetota bacterium]|nr:hypothetical protein [Planctomycetota bacterium]
MNFETSGPKNRLNNDSEQSLFPLLSDQDDLDLVILCDTTESMEETFPEIRRAVTDLVLKI